ncbi:MAG: feruloyl-CoA synthase [Burkholderiaceae bacterium]
MFADRRLFAAPATQVRSLPEGGFVLSSPEPLGPYDRCIGEWLDRWAAQTPDAPAFAERTADGDWRRLSWRQMRTQVGAVAQGLLDLRLAPGAPIVILSDNSLDHLLLMLAGMHLGRAVCSVSSAYCRLTTDYRKIHGILDTLAPALVFAADAAVYGPALAGYAPVRERRLPAVFGAGAGSIPGAMPFSQLLAATEGPQVQAAFAAITPDTAAKYLLTSGSTGHPKVTVNTHRMLCANQQMILQAWRFLEHEKPVLVDWLPWSHTFGGNHNLHMVLRHGGQMIIDEGRPAPGLVEKSVRNLAEIQPTVYFNVPRGLDLVLPLLEQDEALARAFFHRLRAVFYAGAALPQSTWTRLQALAERIRGEPVWLTTAWGSTETAPAITSAYWWLEQAGVIGLPLPGLELKFVPNGEKLEMRVRGVSIFSEYRGEPGLTAAAFDDDGYYRIGDAGYLADPAHPEQGVVFDGRVAEDFKLSTGTWVSVGTLRLQWISALAPLAQDLVVCGHDRDEIGLLVFPSAQAAQWSAQERLARLQAAMAALAEQGGGSSQTPRRALLLDEPPSADAGEITDKGYINQAAVLSRRADQVARLYSGGEGVCVI